MHLFFLNTYQNKETRVLAESPAQYRTNDTPLTYIRLLYDEFFLKNWCVLIKKKGLQQQKTTKKIDWKYFNDKSDNNIVNTDVFYA